MAKSNAERQKEFRLKAKGNFRKLETMLPCNEFDLLHDNAKQAGETKAQYIVALLHGNGAKDSVAANQDDKLLYGSEDLIEELKLIKQQVADGKGSRLAIERLKERVTELEQQLKDSEELRTDTELRQRCNELVEENAKLRKHETVTVNQDEPLDVDAMLAELSIKLPKSASASLKAATGKAIKAVTKECHRQLEEMKAKQISDQREESINQRVKLARDLEEAAKLRDMHYDLVQGVTAAIPRKDYNFIRNCLHPDKEQDPARKKQLTKAFQLFSTLDVVVPPMLGKREKEKRGW